jgi:hypothetical protein
MTDGTNDACPFDSWGCDVRPKRLRTLKDYVKQHPKHIKTVRKILGMFCAQLSAMML